MPKKLMNHTVITENEKLLAQKQNLLAQMALFSSPSLCLFVVLTERAKKSQCSRCPADCQANHGCITPDAQLGRHISERRSTGRCTHGYRHTCRRFPLIDIVIVQFRNTAGKHKNRFFQVGQERFLNLWYLTRVNSIQVINRVSFSSVENILAAGSNGCGPLLKYEETFITQA